MVVVCGGGGLVGSCWWGGFVLGGVSGCGERARDGQDLWWWLGWWMMVGDIYICMRSNGAGRGIIGGAMCVIQGMGVSHAT